MGKEFSKFSSSEGLVGIVSPSTGVSRKEELGIDRNFDFSDLDHTTQELE